MKILVLGYYNFLNAGDDRIQYSITRLLEGHTVVFLPHYLPIPKEYLENFDWILIGGGGLVFERVGIWVDVKKWAKASKAKIGVLGLGVNRVPEDLRPELHSLVEAAEFFFVRDFQSKKLLHNHQKVQVYPDLTWCFPLFSGTLESESKGVALNILSCHWKEFNHDAWIEALKDFKVYPFPFHFGQSRDFDLLKRYFEYDTPTEFSIQPLLECEVLVACRYHAIVFAMQLGKPFIAINYDEKVFRLLQESNLKECCLETTEHDLLKDKLQYVLSHKAEIHQKISGYAQSEKANAQTMACLIRDYMSNDSPEISNSILSLLKSVARSCRGRN
jgi:polysaccharide pyruvyl transferase WcaK-like protein